MTHRLTSVIPFIFFMFAYGCATVMPDMDPPKVSVDSVESISAPSGAPRFKIKLRVANPNQQTLDIAGISYGIEILDEEVISGVTNDVPVIEGYSEEVVTLEAGLQLFQLVKLVSKLGGAGSDALEYKFTAKIDFKGLVPTQRIEEKGELALN